MRLSECSGARPNQSISCGRCWRLILYLLACTANYSLKWHPPSGRAKRRRRINKTPVYPTVLPLMTNAAHATCGSGQCCLNMPRISAWLVNTHPPSHHHLRASSRWSENAFAGIKNPPNSRWIATHPYYETLGQRRFVFVHLLTLARLKAKCFPPVSKASSAPSLCIWPHLRQGGKSFASVA